MFTVQRPLNLVAVVVYFRVALSVSFGGFTTFKPYKQEVCSYPRENGMVCHLVSLAYMYTEVWIKPTS